MTDQTLVDKIQAHLDKEQEKNKTNAWVAYGDYENVEVYRVYPSNETIEELQKRTWGEAVYFGSFRGVNEPFAIGIGLTKEEATIRCTYELDWWFYKGWNNEHGEALKINEIYDALNKIYLSVSSGPYVQMKVRVIKRLLKEVL